jgi:hypothetical protein
LNPRTTGAEIRNVRPTPYGYNATMAKKGSKPPKIITGQEYQEIPIDDIQPHPRNPNQGDVGGISTSIDANDFFGACIVQRSSGYILVGNHRWMAAKAVGMKTIPVLYVECNDERALRILLADNQFAQLASMDENALIDLLKELTETETGLEGTGFTGDDIDEMMAGLGLGGDGSDDKKPDKDEARRNLAQRFGVPPFSVLDARQGYWIERKRSWKALGIDGVQGRHEEGVGKCIKAHRGDYVGDILADFNSGTSVFDPVLAELCMRWLTPRGGSILDPFGGECTKGCVAAHLGYDYTGIEIRADQVEINRKAAKEMGVTPEWINGDSLKLPQYIKKGRQFDLIFTSPPYWNLEDYKGGSKDGSGLESYMKFMEWYEGIFALAVPYLADNRFLCVKVGEVRDRDGAYVDFVGDNIKMFTRMGLHYYNEAILVTSVGTLRLRVTKHFMASRKLGKTHQNVLMFWKGDLNKIGEVLGDDCEFGEPTEDPEDDQS